MDNILLSYVNDYFPLTKATEDPVRFSASGMDFNTDRYEAKGLGSVSLMTAEGTGGAMAMTTLIVNPFSKDAPLLSIDRIEAMGGIMLYVEMFDTTVAPGFDMSGPEAVRVKNGNLPDMDPGKHWYDPMRVGTPMIKKGPDTMKDTFISAEEEYLKAYLDACQTAPYCDPEEKLEKARVYSEGLLTNGGPATDPVKAAIGEEKTGEFFRTTLFGTDRPEAEVDIEHFKNFWKEQQKTARHMEREDALAHILKFIENHNTCALATGIGDFVRCTPIEYTFMDGEFYLYSEGGDKFIGLEKNPNVSLAIFEYYGNKDDSHGLQVMGEATLYPPRCEMFKKVLAFKGIPYDVMKAAKVDVALIRITPKVYEMYDTDFVKAGYDVRQIVRF